MTTNAKVVHLSTVHRASDMRSFQKELRTLAAAGYEAVYIVPHERDEIVDGVRIRAVRRAKGRLGRVTRTAWAVLRAALDEDADLYHIQHVPELLLWTQLLRLRGKPVIYDMHENVPKALLTKTWLPPLLRRVAARAYRLSERLLMRRMPVIFAEESYGRDYPWVHTSTGGNGVVVLNMPRVDDLLAIAVPRADVPTLVYIGGVSEQRGSLVTLAALHLLRERGLRVDWDCVGPLSDGHARALRDQIARWGLADCVRLHGYLPTAQGHRLIAHGQIGLAVLAPIPNYVESYPTKMFEYMALGQAVIVSGFPLYRRVVDSVRCGICLDDPTDPVELANAVQWLLEHPDETAAMGARGREAVSSRYRWDTEAAKLLALYARVLRAQGQATG